MYLSSPTSEDGRNKSSVGILRDSLKGVSREGQWIKVSCASSNGGVETRSENRNCGRVRRKTEGVLEEERGKG
jgi:hypothetical protein